MVMIKIQTQIIKINTEKKGQIADKIKNWHLKYLNTTQAHNAVALFQLLKN